MSALIHSHSFILTNLSLLENHLKLEACCWQVRNLYKIEVAHEWAVKQAAPPETSMATLDIALCHVEQHANVGSFLFLNTNSSFAKTHCQSQIHPFPTSGLAKIPSKIFFLQKHTEYL